MPEKVPPPSASGRRVIASPLARRLAAKAGIDLAALTGSGPHGRIVKADVEAASAGSRLPAPVPGSEVLPPYSEVPHTTMRRRIAENLSRSKRLAPHFNLSVDCVVDDLLSVRERLNSRAGGEEENAVRVTVNDMLIRAAALALHKVPEVNVSWLDHALRKFSRADIAVAVAVEGGLITPVVRDAGNKGLAAIATEMSDLITRAQEGKLAPEEFEGGTFTISNLGMYGVKAFHAIINPPQACILAVGAGEKRPVVKDGVIGVATVMTCTLSVDHRAADGIAGAAFLSAFKRLVEDPLTMLL